MPNMIYALGCAAFGEYRAEGAGILPGHLVEKVPAVNPGTYAADGDCRLHSTAGGNAAPIFALEDGLIGHGVATAYSDNNQVRTVHCHRGDRVYARINDGENVTYGAKLESAGNGTLRVLSTDVISYTETSSVIAEARAACDMSGSAGVDPTGGLCLVEII